MLGVERDQRSAEVARANVRATGLGMEVRLGRVERAERGSGLYRLIAIRPRVDFSSLDTVLLVTGPQPARQDQGAPASPSADPATGPVPAASPSVASPTQGTVAPPGVPATPVRRSAPPPPSGPVP